MGNPILAGKDPTTGESVGVSVDLAQELAKELGATLEPLVADSARESVDAVGSDRADVGLFVVDPLRGEQIAFSGSTVETYCCAALRKFMHRCNTLTLNVTVDTQRHISTTERRS
jgi:polar amino acid transport system substrate-binding protein